MTETTITPDAPQAETSPAEDATPSRLHKFSAYVHVGAGAEECEHGEDGLCEDKDHFHGWCRLPNQFEREMLREKAAAAAARRLRLLADEDSDLRVILDGELRGLQAREARDELIEEVTRKDFLKNHLQAIQEVAEESDGDYDTIDEDRERLRALEAMPADERPTEEFEYLSKRLPEHTEKVNKRREEIEQPIRDSVKDKSVDELVSIVREQRIEALAAGARGEAYVKWQWYICTFKPKSPEKPGFPSERSFSSIDEFTHAAAETVEAIGQTMNELEQEASDSLKG